MLIIMTMTIKMMKMMIMMVVIMAMMVMMVTFIMIESRKNPLTFHYTDTGRLMGILIMVYYNPYLNW